MNSFEKEKDIQHLQMSNYFTILTGAVVRSEEMYKATVVRDRIEGIH